MTPKPPLFSVVINNYNYARYLPESIGSALAQTWPNTEVIVVDDGSTDGSQAVIASYGNRIISESKANGGQGSAVNSGFRLCRGEWVIFLDADDKLLPTAAEEVMRRVGPATSCVQYCLEVVDQDSQPMGVRLPTRPMSEGDIRPILAQFRYHNAPPSSGNAYARRFLEQVLPMPEPDWRIAADAYLILAAPLFGFVESVPYPLAHYRRHGNGASDAVPATLEALHAYVKKELAKETQRDAYVAQLLERYHYRQNGPSYQSPTFCKYTLLMARLEKDAMGPNLALRTLQQVIACAWNWPHYELHHRVVFTIWCFNVFIIPKKMVLRYVGRTLHPHWRRGHLGHLFWQADQGAALGQRSEPS